MRFFTGALVFLIVASTFVSGELWGLLQDHMGGIREGANPGMNGLGPYLDQTCVDQKKGTLEDEPMNLNACLYVCGGVPYKCMFSRKEEPTVGCPTCCYDGTGQLVIKCDKS